MNITRMRVSRRLTFGFGIVIVLLIIISISGINRLSTVNRSFDMAMDDLYPRATTANAVIDEVNASMQAIRNIVISDDQDQIKKEGDRIDAAKKNIDTMFASLEKNIASEQEKTLFKNMVDTRAKYTALQEKLIILVAEVKTDEAKALMFGEMGKQQAAYFDALRKFAAFQGDAMKHLQKAGNEVYNDANRLIILLLVLGIALSSVVTFWITRSIMKQLGGEPDYAVTIAEKIAAGELTVAIDAHPNDQTSLLVAIKTMRDGLVKIVSQVREGTDTIAAASDQIASGNLDLSTRTERENGALQETASSIEELSGTIRQTADNARQANQLAQSASEVAAKGGSVVSQVVETMGSINASSQKIADIIGVIDGIAFQTNILALNAAVEAARAGEQGRGFAVVATEVRNLAQRSASAAKEIKVLIGDSVEKVNAGTKLVDQAGVTMEEVVTSVKRVSDIIGEIASASHEQTAGIEQISNAITQMDDSTQQNAALVEEASAAAKSMQEQTANLAQVVGIFKLSDQHRLHVVPSSAPRASDLTPKASQIAKTKNRPIAVTSSKAAASAMRKPSTETDDWEEF